MIASLPAEREAPLLAKYRTIDYANGHLTVRAIKRQIDGALGSRGAWLLEPYTDKPDSVGFNTANVADIAETARLADAGDRMPASFLGQPRAIFARVPDNMWSIRCEIG